MFSLFFERDIKINWASGSYELPGTKAWVGCNIEYFHKKKHIIMVQYWIFRQCFYERIQYYSICPSINYKYINNNNVYAPMDDDRPYTSISKPNSVYSAKVSLQNGT